MTLSYRHIITKTFLDVIVSDEKFCVLNLKIETLVLKNICRMLVKYRPQ